MQVPASHSNMIVQVSKPGSAFRFDGRLLHASSV